MANEDKKTCGTEDKNKNTNRNKGEEDEEKDTMDGTEELDDDEKQETMEGEKEPIEIHDPKINGYSFFGVGGSRNKNQKDRTDIINRSTIEAIEKEENGSINEESAVEDDKDTIDATDAMGTMGTTEEDSDSYSTTSKNKARNEDDGFILEEGEIVEDEGNNTEASVASNLGATGVMVKSTGGNHPVDLKDGKDKNKNKRSKSNKKKRESKKRKNRKKKE